MISENTKNKLPEIREAVLTILLAIWILIPFLKETRIICYFALVYEYIFILITGFIGLICLIYDTIKQYKKYDNKKQYFKERLPMILLLAFMAWTFISSIFAQNIKNAFWGDEYRKDGYISYLAYAGFFGCAFLIKSKELKKLLINLFIGIAVLNIILIELANKGLLTNIFYARTVTRTCFHNINHYAYYLLLATASANFMFITEKKKLLKIIYVLVYAFLLYYLILNNTLGTYIALGMTLILFLGYCIYHKKGRTLAIISISIFIILSIWTNLGGSNLVKENFARMFGDFKNISLAEIAKKLDSEDKDRLEKIAGYGGSGRINLWRNGIIFFLENPVLGYGPENLGELYKEQGIEQDRPHNLLIQQATTSGIIGLVTYISAMGIILIVGLKNMKLENGMHIIVYANVLAYLMSAMFGNSMYYTSPYFFIFLGLLMFENIEEIKMNKKKDSIGK